MDQCTASGAFDRVSIASTNDDAARYEAESRHRRAYK